MRISIDWLANLICLIVVFFVFAPGTPLKTYEPIASRHWGVVASRIISRVRVIVIIKVTRTAAVMSLFSKEHSLPASLECMYICIGVLLRRASKRQSRASFSPEVPIAKRISR